MEGRGTGRSHDPGCPAPVVFGLTVLDPKLVSPGWFVTPSVASGRLLFFHRAISGKGVFALSRAPPTSGCT